MRLHYYALWPTVYIHLVLVINIMACYGVRCGARHRPTGYSLLIRCFSEEGAARGAATDEAATRVCGLVAAGRLSDLSERQLAAWRRQW